MKSFIICFAFLGFLSVARAQEVDVPADVPLSEIMKRATCEIQVTKPIIILKNEDYGSASYFLIGVKQKENSVRRIPVGRKILITSMDQYFIQFKDKSIDRACLRKTLDDEDIFCTPLKGITILDLEKQSDGAVTVVCRDDDPTEI